MTIVGTPETQWKAQFFIFEKIIDEYGGGNDDVKLTVYLVIPSSHVGMLIGKVSDECSFFMRMKRFLCKLIVDFLVSQNLRFLFGVMVFVRRTFIIRLFTKTQTR